MHVALDHTIVRCRDATRSARFVTELLGLPPPQPVAGFLAVPLANGVTLDFLAVDDAEVASQHYAFAIGGRELDEVHARLRERDVAHWADPGRTRAGEVGSHGGARHLYFDDPDGHLLEVLARSNGDEP